MPMPHALWSIGYVSVAPQPLSRHELDGILDASRGANAQAGVTGLLLHCDGSFLQVIEGPRPGVDHIFGRITRSPLHCDILQLFDEPIDAREFGDWDMACKEVMPAELHLLRDAPAGSRRKLLAAYWAAWQ